MHAYLKILEDVFGYSKGDIVPALKDNKGYILLTKDYERIYLNLDDERIKEISFYNLVDDLENILNLMQDEAPTRINLLCSINKTINRIKKA